MKILVVSLLRLGDIIQQKPLLRALHGKYPQAEIHLLVNRQFASVADLLQDDVQHIHFFERDLLQRSMGESSYNMFAPFAMLEELLQNLQNEKFDLALNWTHNKLSAFLMGTLDIPKKEGLHIREAKLLGLESPWLRYFNDHYSENSHSFFHYIELLGNAFELPYERHKLRGDLTEASTIYLQCLTSDTKKNWYLPNFKALKEQIEKSYPQFRVQILAADSEVPKLLTVFMEEDLVVCNLLEAQQLLAQARALISLDTSIKHLAAALGTPVLEIALGGSHVEKNAAFVEHSQALQGQSACYPCQHSQRCLQKSHLCGDSLSVADVMTSLSELLQKTSSAPGQGFLLEQAQQNRNRYHEVEKAIWSAYLNKSDAQIALSNEEAQELLRQTENLLKYQMDFESCENFNQIFTSLQVIAEQKLDVGFYFQKLAQVFKDRFASAEAAFSALKKGLEQSQSLLQVRLTLINQTLSMDGGTHAERT